MSSSPPSYEDYYPSHDRSEREPPSEDHNRKRRRIEPENIHPRNMTDPSRPPPSRRTPSAFPSPYDFLGPPLHGISSSVPLGLPIGTFLQEDAALDYAVSGFAHDLGGIDFNQPPGPPMFLNPDQAPQAAALTSHPSQPALRHESGLTLFRPLPDDYIPPPRAPAIPERRREGDGAGTGPPPTFSSRHLAFDFSGPPPYRAPSYPSHIPVIEGISPPRRVPTATSTTPSTATNEVPKKQTTMLVLSRATEESIEALDEHKRECPTCCLEFTPDTFVAVITCCNMAIHVRCFSAYVNSQGYSKNRVCMKCRRGIDAKYVLNKVVPPVTDKDWDEGVDFNAPESLQGDAKMELNVTARPHRSGYHRSRNPGSYPGYRGGRHAYFNMVDGMTSEQRLAFLHLREEQVHQTGELRTRLQAASENSTRLNREDLEANRAVVEAQSRATTEELTIMLQKTRETRAAHEGARAAYEKIQLELDAMQQSQQRRLQDMMEEFHVEREVREREARSRPEELHPRSAPIPVPQLRVVNGEPSNSRSP
ncbi:hypothetical protein H2200_013066 [Cladophialophora chaetospira]|uniref:RING-type domain-containing protein n=1 Tax=Cladophialophora chaetospira TaxID=386627 RepID=A0AA39CBS3_9EURO|nr:hypothetical protein H2200_013066 [Cladophialophora chaetospira]